MPQYPQQPQGYPQQYAPPMPQQQPYAPPMPQGYPQAYPQQYAAPAPPAQPLPTGSLDSYYQQPSSTGGPSWKFNGKPIGTQYAGIVARTVTDSDVRAQTDNAGRPQVYKDGRPKFVMVVPMQVQPSPEFPDGMAGWWVKGQARDELARAMAEAGAPTGAPEAGAAIRVTLVGQRAVPNMNPQLLYRVEYMRPNGAAPAPVQQLQVQQPAAPAPVGPPADQPMVQYAPAPAAAVGQQPLPDANGQPVMHQQPAQQAAPQPAPAPTPAQQPAAQPAAAPAGFNPEQAALFAKLTGQPAS